MPKINIFFLISLFIFFNSCDETEVSSKKSVNSKKLVTITIDAGSDKIVKINKIMNIEGRGRSSDNSQLSYFWKKNGKTLSTSAIFQYRPTVLGIDTLEFSVQHNSGEVITDMLKLTVIETQVTSQIPTLPSSTIQEYLDVINKARLENQECGTKGSFPRTMALTWSDKLYKSSYEHSYDLAYSRTFAHAGSGTKLDWTGYALGKKSTLSERIEAYNYDWNYIGENIGAGTNMDRIEKMVNGWLESDSHCANLMSPNFKEVGVAMVKNIDSTYTHYWTQDFGTSR